MSATCHYYKLPNTNSLTIVDMSYKRTVWTVLAGQGG